MSNFSCGENKTVKEKDPCQKNICISDSCWIERPRFFNGQMLTDTDLKSGQDYAIEKNKLHNRYLHGWGVVCGLKVKCYPCCEGHGSSGKVVVEPGYAIDCCGNDLVVCEAQEYDVIKRINQMKKKQKESSSPCESGTITEESSCSEEEEKYYLVISYSEEEGKPTSALNAGDPCSIQRCEPTRTKECFQLDLVKFCTLEPTEEENLFTRMKKCWTLFSETWKRVINKELNWKVFFSLKAEDLKSLIKEYYKVLPVNVHCDVLDRLEEGGTSQTRTIQLGADQATELNKILLSGNYENAVNLLNDVGLTLSDDAIFSQVDETTWTVTDGNYSYQIRFTQNTNGEVIGATITVNESSLKQLYVILFQLFLDCICQAFLIPSPTCGKDDVVILATITVKNNKIEKICNLSRKYVLTANSLKYWLLWIPDLLVSILFKKWAKKNYNFTLESIGDLLEFLCCILDISQVNSLPPYIHILKFMENDLEIPQMMGEKVQESMAAMVKEFMQPLDPQNVSFKAAVNKDAEESKEMLKKLNIEVVGKEKYDPSAKRLNLEEIVGSIPTARPGSKVIQLVDDSGKVKGFRVVKTVSKEEEKESSQAADELIALKTQMLEMNKKMKVMEKELEKMKTKTQEVKQTQVPKQRQTAGREKKAKKK